MTAVLLIERLFGDTVSVMGWGFHYLALTYIILTHLITQLHYWLDLPQKKSEDRSWSY